MALFALDLETVCNVASCHGFGGYKKCDHALSPWHDRITCIAVASVEGTKVFNDLDSFRNWVINRPEEDTYVGANFKFDMLHLWVHLGEVFGELYPRLDQWVGDSMLAGYVCTDKIPDSWLADYNIAKKNYEGQRDAGKHSLKTMAPYFLGKAPFWETIDHNNDLYVGTDASYTLELTAHMEDRLKKLDQCEFYKESLLPWTKMLLQAEYKGICIDLEALSQKEVEICDKIKELTGKLDSVWDEAHAAYAGLQLAECHNCYEKMALARGLNLEPGSRYRKLFEAALTKLETKINYDSPKQMTWLLRDFLGYDISTIEGKESTGVEVLERLKSEGKQDVALFLELRSCEKLLSGFIQPYKEMAVDGVIHPSFNPARTTTGRLSSSKPNLQQVPPELRPLFVPRPGHKFISYDYSGIEAVLIAVYSDDPALFEIIDKGLSIHCYNTKVFFGLDCDVKDVKKLYPAERQAAKTVSFALFYNAGANRIQTAFTQAGFPITELQARNIHRKFKDAYAKAYSYGQQVVKHLEDGESLPNLLGRPIKIQNPEECYMTGFNSLIQGSASDITLHSAFESARVQYIEPLLFVHDSVTFEVPDNCVSSADDYIKMCFTDYKFNTANGPLKLSIEGGVADRWEK